METYRWHHGVKNHVLKGRVRNPHYIGDASKEEDEIAETTQTQKTDWENILADNPLKETAGYKLGIHYERLQAELRKQNERKRETWEQLLPL